MELPLLCHSHTAIELYSHLLYIVLLLRPPIIQYLPYPPLVSSLFVKSSVEGVQPSKVIYQHQPPSIHGGQRRRVVVWLMMSRVGGHIMKQNRSFTRSSSPSAAAVLRRQHGGAVGGTTDQSAHLVGVEKLGDILRRGCLSTPSRHSDWFKVFQDLCLISETRSQHTAIVVQF